MSVERDGYLGVLAPERHPFRRPFEEFAMHRFAPIAALLLVAGCNSPDQPTGEENAAQAAATTANVADQQGVVPPDAVTQPGYGTENAAGDVFDSQDTVSGNVAAPQ